MARTVPVILLLHTLVLLGGPGPAAAQEEPYLLRLKGEVGDQWLTLEVQEQTASLPGVPPVHRWSATVSRHRIEQVDPETAARTLARTCERVVGQIESPGSALRRYDSAATGSEAPSVTADAMISLRARAGARFEMEVTPTGLVQSFRGAEAVRDRLLSLVPPDRPLVRQVVQQAAAGITDAALREEARAMYRFLPRDPVAIGDSWEDRGAPGDGDAPLWDGPCRYRLETVDEVEGRRVATISIQVLPAAPDSTGGGGAAGARPIGQGSIRFDLDRGRVLSRRTEVRTTVPTPMGIDAPARASEGLRPAREEDLTRPLSPSTAPAVSTGAGADPDRSENPGPEEKSSDQE